MVHTLARALSFTAQSMVTLFRTDATSSRAMVRRVSSPRTLTTLSLTFHDAPRPTMRSDRALKEQYSPATAPTRSEEQSGTEVRELSREFSEFSIMTLPTKVLSDSLGRIGSLKRTSDKSLFPMALGSCGHRITHQLRPINMNGRSILSVMSVLAMHPRLPAPSGRARPAQLP